MAEDTKKDQRVKAPVLRAKYKSRTLDEFIDKYSRDISRSGMWIKSGKPPPLGTLLKVEILLEDGTPVIAAVGRVAKRREESEASPDNPAGMGIRFLKVEEGSQPVIDRIVALKGEDAGPHFDAPRAAAAPAATPGAETNSAFFGSTNPSKDMPPEAERTMMRQMNALLGEALRQVNESAPRKPGDNAQLPTQKATIMGVAAPQGMLEQAIAAARDETRKADEGPTKVASRSEIDSALEKLKSLEEPGDAPKPDVKKPDVKPAVDEKRSEVQKPPPPSKPLTPRSPMARTPTPAPPSTRSIESEPAAKPESRPSPAPVEAKVEAPAAEPAKVEEPRVEPAKVEEPKAEEPRVEPAKVEEPRAEEPEKVEEPVAPKADEPVAEPAKVEEPVTAKADESVAEPAKVEEVVAVVAKVEEPRAEKPKAEEKRHEESKSDVKPTEKKPEEKKAPPAPEPEGNLMSMVMTVAIIAALALAVWWFLLRTEPGQHPSVDAPQNVSATLAKPLPRS